jgi:hypothetical protein
MERKQMNVSEMLLTVEEFMTTNLSSFENRPAILAVIDELKTGNPEIKHLAQAQSTSTKADYAIKVSGEETLIATAVKVSDGLKVIAATTKDERLKIDAQVSQWELGHMRKDDMYTRILQLHATALPFVAQLLPLKITKADVDSLDTESTKLMKVKPAINVKAAKATRATGDLGDTISELDAVVIETLDDLMLEYKLLNPTLYAEYLIARKINHRAAGHSSKDTTPTPTE